MAEAKRTFVIIESNYWNNSNNLNKTRKSGRYLGESLAIILTQVLASHMMHADTHLEEGGQTFTGGNKHTNGPHS